MSVSESAARAARDRGETKDADLEYLRALCPPGTTVYTTLRHVSRSGMLRIVAAHVISTTREGERDLAWLPSPRIARVTSFTDDKKRDGNRIPGCGTDVGFELVYNLSRALYRHLTPAQVKAEAQRLNLPGDLTDPGYLLRQRWV